MARVESSKRLIQPKLMGSASHNLSCL